MHVFYNLFSCTTLPGYFSAYSGTIGVKIVLKFIKNVITAPPQLGTTVLRCKPMQKDRNPCSMNELLL